MKEKKYFKEVNLNFDLTEELKVSVTTAQFFIDVLGQDKEATLAEMNITPDQYERYKNIPQS